MNEDIEILGFAGVDSGELLVIDPCYIDNDELVADLIERGLAVKFQTMLGDGYYPVVDFKDGHFMVDTTPLED